MLKVMKSINMSKQSDANKKTMAWQVTSWGAFNPNRKNQSWYGTA